jgi:hypothetical protein
MFRATPSVVSAVSSFGAKGRQTMHHVSATPPFYPVVNICALQITIMDEKNTIDCLFEVMRFHRV